MVLPSNKKKSSMPLGPVEPDSGELDDVAGVVQADLHLPVGAVDRDLGRRLELDVAARRCGGRGCGGDSAGDGECGGGEGGDECAPGL